MTHSPVANGIRKKLRDAFSPTELIVEDESARHIGHEGANPKGETHFRVRIVSQAFDGLSRIERHRQVHAVLSDELKKRVHAIALTTLTPSEAE